jgi:alanine or glycine:cation symporter, AGCS family
MFDPIFQSLDQIDAFFWGYIGFGMVIFLGCYFTIYTGLFQLKVFPAAIQTFFDFLWQTSGKTAGTHPVKVFFASAGGMIGVGNVIGIVTALQLGGPGALLWVWMAAFFGMIIKYSEVYLGLRFRVLNHRNGYDGGPMFYVAKAFAVPWLPTFICVLLCVYGAEIYQFSVIVETVSTNWDVDRFYVVPLLLFVVLYACLGGIPRVAKICGLFMPIFIGCYLAMCLWVIGHHIEKLPDILLTVIKSAFSGHAAIGGFAGGSMMLAIQNGMAGACYSADIGSGYDAIIQSESRTVYPEQQARMALLAVCVDNLICTMSILVVLCTGLLYSSEFSNASNLVQIAFEQYFPQVSVIMPIFIFILAYTTLITYISVGLKCARYIHPKRGQMVYFFYTIAALVTFSFLDQSKALLVIRLAGVLLLIINLCGIFRMRHEISFTLEDKKTKTMPILS